MVRSLYNPSTGRRWRRIQDAIDRALYGDSSCCPDCTGSPPPPTPVCEELCCDYKVTFAGTTIIDFSYDFGADHTFETFTYRSLKFTGSLDGTYVFNSRRPHVSPGDCRKWVYSNVDVVLYSGSNGTGTAYPAGKARYYGNLIFLNTTTLGGPFEDQFAELGSSDGSLIWGDVFRVGDPVVTGCNCCTKTVENNLVWTYETRPFPWPVASGGTKTVENINPRVECDCDDLGGMMFDIVASQDDVYACLAATLFPDAVEAVDSRGFPPPLLSYGIGLVKQASDDPCVCIYESEVFSYDWKDADHNVLGQSFHKVRVELKHGDRARGWLFRCNEDGSGLSQMYYGESVHHAFNLYSQCEGPCDIYFKIIGPGGTP